MYNRTPVPGQRYRHFKGGLYQIVTCAKHSETMEEFVIYQALYGDYTCYARPLAMFTGLNDEGKARFELVTESTEVNKKDNTKGDIVQNIGQDVIHNEDNTAEEHMGANDLLFRILDCDKSRDKLDLLRRYRDELDYRTLENVAISLDLVIDTEDEDEIFGHIAQYLETRVRFETDRLR